MDRQYGTLFTLVVRTSAIRISVTRPAIDGACPYPQVWYSLDRGLELHVDCLGLRHAADDTSCNAI
jgi:hypothetical protein